MINRILNSVFGNASDKLIKTLRARVAEVHDHTNRLQSISHDELRGETAALRENLYNRLSDIQSQIDELRTEAQDDTTSLTDKDRLYKEVETLEDKRYQEEQKVLNEILPHAFAVLKETARRYVELETLSVAATEHDQRLSTQRDCVSIQGNKAVWQTSWNAAGKPIDWDMVHYDVQLIGGMVLHSGKIAEMATGEGKTLVATLPIYLNALTGRGVHVVTVNEYLAKRDAAWIGPLLEFHGLRVDCIDAHPSGTDQRRNAYKADVTYGTNSEFGFDYLRDNMAGKVEELVQREHHYAIVDEVDSVLVDDARTPLIISGPSDVSNHQQFVALKPQLESLVQLQRTFLLSELNKAKALIKEGNSKEGGFHLLRVHRGLPKNKALIKYLSQEGIKDLLQKTENRYLQDNAREMPKVDQELYFVIEEKQNSIELSDKGIDTISTADDPDFFLLPDVSTEVGRIEGNASLSEIERSEQKKELYANYNLKSERIHVLNQLLRAYTLFEKDVEYVLVDGKIKIVDEQTGRIMEGRRYSDGLHQAIEAKENVKIEAASQTMATITLQNYFRMYRKLAGMTGTAETEAKEFWEIYNLDVVVIPTNRPIQRDDRNDLVFKTMREKFNAIIEQVVKLRNENRPVLVGTTSVEISELLSRALKIRKINHNVLNAKLHKREADIVAEAGKAGVVTIATNMAGRGTDIKLSDEVKEAGGLAIIGSERHESRRIDRQLRGRSGRQGDVGSSQFFVSLEDNLMRLFGSERIARVMDRLGHKEGDVIEHSMISKSIERAQKKIEENHFGVRKRLLEYDNVMNAQREVIYKKRKNALYGRRLTLDIANMFYDVIENIVDIYTIDNNFEVLTSEIGTTFGYVAPIQAEDIEGLPSQEIADLLFQKIYSEYYKEKNKTNAEVLLNVFTRVKVERGGQEDVKVHVPFTDKTKVVHVVESLQDGYESKGISVLRAFEKNTILVMIDELWKHHLKQMDDLKQSTQSAVYEQKDPLLIYKFEAFELFKGLTKRLSHDVVSFLSLALLPSQADTVNSRSSQTKRSPKYVENRGASPEGGKKEVEKNEPVTAEPKIGRNQRVVIRHAQTGEEKNIKYKQAIPLIERDDSWAVVSTK